MRFDFEDLEVYLKPHGDNSEPSRVCERPGIQIGGNFKTAWVYAQWKTDSKFDIVISFGKNFKLGSANIIQIDVRAGKGQTNHCFRDSAVFGIQTSWVQGQQHVLSSFTAKAYNKACCSELQADGAGKPIALSDPSGNVPEGSSEKNWAFLIRPMQHDQVWGKAGKRKSFEGKSFDRDTTPGNITVYVTRGTVTWDSPNEVDHNPAEKRVCSPKSMANFKTLPGQEGDPYIAEFRALDHSKIPTFWLETYRNGQPKMPHKYENGLIVQQDAAFNEAIERTHDLRQRMSSEWNTRKAELQSLHNGRRNTRSSSGSGLSTTQSTMAQGDEAGVEIALATYTGRQSAAESNTMETVVPEESPRTKTLPEITFCDCPKDHTPKRHKEGGMARARARPVNRSEGRGISSQTSTADLIDRCKPCGACGNPKVALKNRDDYKSQMQKVLASQRGDSRRIETPDREKLPIAPTTLKHPRKHQATESSTLQPKGFFARFANDIESSSDERPLSAIPQKRKHNDQTRKQRTGSLASDASPRPIAAQQQSAEESSLHDDSATPNLDDRSGTQASEATSTAEADGRIGNDDGDSPVPLGRNSSIQFARDSNAPSSKDSQVHVEEEEPLSHVSGSNNLLKQGDPQPVHESANGRLMQRAATADMGSGVSDANSKIGLGTHPAEVSHPHEAAIPSQQTHLPPWRYSNEAMRTHAESWTQKGNTTLGLSTDSPYTSQDTQDYSEGALRQQLYPTSNQHNENTDGQHKQAYSRSSIDQGQARRLEQYASPAPSDGHQHRGDSVVPDQRIIGNTPAPSMESARSPSMPPGPQDDVVDLTNCDDDSPSSANNRQASQTAMDSAEQEREVEDRLARTRRKKQRLQIQRQRLIFDERLIDLEDEEYDLLEQKRQLATGRVVKSEPSGIVKSEQ
ncbi:hypothetical protein D0863_06673 [Hortaea werneckii]|uniref:Uncharacterized protein n=1 Tax=Hortaea werneckii TaxID=91943 RepID=A0A3M7DXR5_HORWE|nr:hypothetical protein D0863_06673 [Hortaea werneckii]